MKKLVTELKQIIKNELAKCNEDSIFYNMIQSKEGYDRAEEMILTYAMRNSLSISSAIGLLESTLSE